MLVNDLWKEVSVGARHLECLTLSDFALNSEAGKIRSINITLLHP